jgi:hypothetical protein
MRTARDILSDHQLLTPEALTAEQLVRRVSALAEFAASYDASYQLLSGRLQRQARKLKAAEDTAADLVIAAGQLRDVMRHHAAAVGALVAWHGARGTPKEQAAADMLLAALAAFREPAPELD